MCLLFSVQSPGGTSGGVKVEIVKDKVLRELTREVAELLTSIVVQKSTCSIV